MKQQFIKLIDLIDVPSMLGISALIAQVKDILGIIMLLFTGAYTFWKWKKEFKESKLKKNEKL